MRRWGVSSEFPAGAATGVVSLSRQVNRDLTGARRIVGVLSAQVGRASLEVGNELITDQVIGPFGVEISAAFDPAAGGIQVSYEFSAALGSPVPFTLLVSDEQ